MLNARGRYRAFVSPLTFAVCAATLAGCAEGPYDDYHRVPTSMNTARRSATRIPLPDRALLTAQPAPDCEGKPATPDADTSTQPSDPNADLAFRIKLEYERECYRQGEIRARDRLRGLQESTAETVKATRRLEQNDR